jgi:quercetin dioxygenase-like cupin family protein
MTSASVPSNTCKAQPCVPIATGASDAVSRELQHVRVSRMEFASGRLASHYHEHAALCVILEGGFTKRFRGRRLDCVAGTLLIQPAGERHSDEFRGSRQLVLEPLRAEDSPFAEHSLFEEIVHTRSALGVASATRIAHELRKTDVWSSLAIEGMALELVARIGRCSDGSAPQGAGAPRWLAQVRERLTSGRSIWAACFADTSGFRSVPTRDEIAWNGRLRSSRPRTNRCREYHFALDLPTKAILRANSGALPE